MVEHGSNKPRVVGSSPTVTIFFHQPHLWPSGLRRYVQVVVFIRRRRFESCGVHVKASMAQLAERSAVNR